MADIKPWDLHTSEERTEDGLTTFIIFCEDEVSEPIYFRSFSNDKVKINEVPNQRSGRLNLNNAIEKCEKDGLVVWNESGYVKADGIKEHIWCVYDRDLENIDLANIKAANNIEFDTAIGQAEAAGMQVAWSNDCFELWILLHFEDVPGEPPFHRNYIYERLTAVFKALPDQSEELANITQKENFNYKHSFKKEYRFRISVLPYLKVKERREQAFARALALEDFHGRSNPYHARNPCTMVHQLVNSIVRAGGN